MIKIKLTALEHPAPENINCNDRKEFASTVLWLEDQKIRHYRIEDRQGLREVENLNDWEKYYIKYKEDLGVPKFKTPTEEMCWLLSYAIRLEYLDAPEKYESITSKNVLEQSSKAIAPSVKTQNTFDNIDFSHPDFVSGVRTLASKLGIASHPNHLIQLEAIKRVIHERLSTTTKKEAIIDGKPFPFEKGNDIISDDPQLDYAARVLRLLQIQSLRKLQTKINETIVAVQDLTADPKTDTKLGKVGF